MSTGFCKCGQCLWMPSQAECVCCKDKKFEVKMPSDSCVTEHPDFDNIINKGSCSN